jgi:hypothetical protein
VASCVPNPTQPNAPMAFTATVSAPPPYTIEPTGTMGFFEGADAVTGAGVFGGTATSFDWSTTHLGARSFHAAYMGDSTFRGCTGPEFTEHIVADAHLGGGVTSVRDVAGDEGAHVRVAFTPSPLEQYPFNPTEYHVERHAPPGHGVPTGWTQVAVLPSPLGASSSVVLTTTTDSTEAWNPLTQFRLVVVMEELGEFTSDSLGGYSVDNLAPPAPAWGACSWAGGSALLNWNATSARDFWTFRLYRGPDQSFVPQPSNLVVSQTGLSYVDEGAPTAWYRLSAVDIHGNEGPSTAILPSGTAGLPAGPPLRFALDGARPNPARGGRLSIAFSLPVAMPATLEVLDVGGRRVASREVGSLGAGRHTLALGDPRRLAPGIYQVRLRQGARVSVTRVAVLD